MPRKISQSKLISNLTIYLVYPASDKVISTPDAIGFHLKYWLTKFGFRVIHFSLIEDVDEKFIPSKSDILLGHPRFSEDSTFLKLQKKQGWRKVIVLHPFCPKDLFSYAFLYKTCLNADKFLAITGRYWADNISNTIFSSWKDKFTQLDLGVSKQNYPRIKIKFNPPGKRKFLFVGNHPHYKNVKFLDQIAKCFPEIEFHRIGPIGKFKHLIQHGSFKLNDQYATKLIKQMDFMITMGIRDANPTTVLECASLGLISVCPEGSGYYETDGVYNICGDDIKKAKKTISLLNHLPNRILEKKRASMDALISKRYTWRNFSVKVMNEILKQEAETYQFNSYLDVLKINIYLALHKKASWRVKLKKRFYSLFRKL